MDPALEQYLATLPGHVRDVVLEIHRIAHEVVPDGVDTISYGIPTLRVDGTAVVHYAGWKQHVSLYPVPAGDPALTAQLAPYAGGKGTLRFPLSEPLPADLVRRAVAALAER